MGAEHLLVVDDDGEIRHLLAKILEKYNYQVSGAKNGEEMFAILSKQKIDLVILDVMLPGTDGFTLCRQLRQDSMIPIIMLTAAGEETDRIVGLEIGADDYLAKPFNPRELIARIKAILRRTGNQSQSLTKFDKHESSSLVLEFCGWNLDTGKRRLISPEGIEVTISSGEYILLMAFLKSSQKVLSRDYLLDMTQNRPAGPFDRSIDVQVSRLRQKIEENPKKPTLIKTVRGGGYLFTAQVKQKPNSQVTS